MKSNIYDKLIVVGMIVVGLFGCYYGYSQFVTPYVLKSPDQSNTDRPKVDFEIPKPLKWEIKSLPTQYEPLFDK